MSFNIQLAEYKPEIFVSPTYHQAVIGIYEFPHVPPMLCSSLPSGSIHLSWIIFFLLCRHDVSLHQCILIILSVWGLTVLNFLLLLWEYREMYSYTTYCNTD